MLSPADRLGILANFYALEKIEDMDSEMLTWWKFYSKFTTTIQVLSINRVSYCGFIIKYVWISIYYHTKNSKIKDCKLMSFYFDTEKNNTKMKRVFNSLLCASESKIKLHALYWVPTWLSIFNIICS